MSTKKKLCQRVLSMVLALVCMVGVLPAGAMAAEPAPAAETGSVLTIEKRDLATGNPIKDCLFQLRYLAGTSGDGGTLIGQQKTDAKGQATFTGLKAGNYIVEELEAAEGFNITSASKSIYISGQPGDKHTIDFTNKPDGSLLIQKVCSVNPANFLKGAQFKVEWVNGGTVGPNKDGLYTTDEHGSILIEGLEPGKSVKITETKAPDGYIGNETATVATLAGQVVSKTFKNTPKSSITIEKRSSADNTTLQGAEFTITNGGGCAVTKDGTVLASGKSGDIFTTGQDGRVTIPNLVPGVYILQEITAPKGYHIDFTSTTVEVKAGENKVVIIKDTPLSSLVIEKRDSLTKEPLKGAQFKVTSNLHGDITAGSNNGVYTTNEEGQIVIPGLESDTYTISEVKAPDGYHIDTASQSAVLKKGEVVVSTFYDTPKNTLYIVKRDSVTGAALPGAEFEVKDSNNHMAGGKPSYTTDGEGVIKITGLATGRYTITEVKAPDGYQKDAASQYANVGENATDASNTNHAVTFYNTPLNTLVIKKQDAKTGNFLPGAVFTVADNSGNLITHSDKTGSTNGIYTTDVNGEITITGLQPDTYVVTEIQAPANYEMDATPQTVTIGQNSGTNKTHTLIFNDTPYNTLVIQKRDTENGMALEGATFEVTNKKGSFAGNFTTDKNGEVTVANLPADTYYIKEVQTSNGYQMDAASQNVSLSGGETRSVTFYDTKLNTLIIEKRDSITQKLLAGAEFKITHKDGKPVENNGLAIGDNGRFTTDETGRISLPELQPDTYLITELTAPAGYQKDAPSQTVVLEPGSTKNVTFYDTPLNTLVIEKRDSVTREPLANAVFKVTDANGKVVNQAGDAIAANGTFTTDASGKITLTGLEPVTYVITEVSAPTGYHIDAPSQTVKLGQQDTQSVVFYDTPLNTLNIIKKDAATGQPLAGATFYVTNQQGQVADNVTGFIGSNGYYTTDASGQITLVGLPSDTYIVRETTAPNGYLLDNTPQTVKVYDGATYSLTFYNQPEGSLIIEKRDKLTNEPLYGATFRIRTASGDFVAQGGELFGSNGLFTTDRSGRITVVGLKPGTYVVTEETAPSGYELDAPSQTVEVKANNTQTLTFYDSPIGGLVITKVDASTGERLAGAKLEVRKDNGGIIGTYTTDQKGNIQIPALESGWYTVTEIKAPDGYILDSNPQQVEVKDGQQATLEFANKAAGGIVIHKVDSQTKRGIAGVQFTVYDSFMNPIGQYASEADGYVRMHKTLKDGKYYVRETKAAAGYIADNSLKSFVISGGGATTIEWENTAEYGQIQIIKTSADYNTQNGQYPGTALSGAKFTIYDASGNVVDTVETNASGVASSKLLPLGTYTVKETKAPVNYGLNPQTYTVNVSEANKVYKLQVTNKSIALGVAINKTGPKQSTNNSYIKYQITGVANTSNQPLKSFYWRDTINTDAVRLTGIKTGTYSMTQNYKVTYTTNLNPNYRTAYDNLTTKKDYDLDMSAGALGLASNEYVTSVMLSFGVVPSGFHMLNPATVTGHTLYALKNGITTTNKADVGGLYGEYWQQAMARWTTTIVSNYQPPKMPRTGY